MNSVLCNEWSLLYILYGTTIIKKVNYISIFHKLKKINITINFEDSCYMNIRIFMFILKNGGFNKILITEANEINTVHEN